MCAASASSDRLLVSSPPTASTPANTSVSASTVASARRCACAALPCAWSLNGPPFRRSGLEHLMRLPTGALALYHRDERAPLVVGARQPIVARRIGCGNPLTMTYRGSLFSIEGHTRQIGDRKIGRQQPALPRAVRHRRFERIPPNRILDGEAAARRALQR